jgi:hypothetical protein
MRTRFKVLIGVLGISLALGLPWTLLWPGDTVPESRPVAAGANPSALEASFAAWTADHEARGGDRNVFLALGW